MHVTLMLALAGMAPAAPLPDQDKDPTAVVLRLRCPNAADLAVCKKLFSTQRVFDYAVQHYWVSGLPAVKAQKDPASWLKRHLHVTTSGRDTIRILVTGDMPKRDRAALANAVLSAWQPVLTGSGLREKFADVKAERRAYEAAQRRTEAARDRLADARHALTQVDRTDPAATKEASDALKAAESEYQCFEGAFVAARLRLGRAAAHLPFLVVHLADGPHDPGTEAWVEPRPDSRQHAPSGGGR
jgi:hypothetical protein